MTWPRLASSGMVGITRRMIAEERWILPEAVPTQALGEVGSTSVTGESLDNRCHWH